MFWGHTVCWTDRAIRRQFLGSDLKPVNQTYRTLPSDQRLKLNFPGGRKASLDPGKLQWLPPRPYQDGRDRLVKVVESRKTACGAREATTGHREAIGAYADLREDDKWLKQSLFPGLRTRVYSLCEDLHGSLVGIQAVDALQGGSYVPPETYRVVDSQGILDVQILKGWRLWRTPVGTGKTVVTVDELAFVFDRTGEVAYVAATSDKLSHYVPASGEDNWLNHWLAAHS